jgi:hypothetical protein
MPIENVEELRPKIKRCPFADDVGFLANRKIFLATTEVASTC